MELGPRDIHDKQFHDAWRGYNQEEVDDFLDRVADSLDQVQRANQSLTERVRALEAQLSQAREGEQMLKKTLVTAQQHAEEAMAAARARADKLVADATERARAIGDDARNKASAVESEARKRAQETERRAEQRKRELDLSIEKLRALEAETKQKLRSFLDGQQRALTTLSERRLGAPPPTGAGPAASPQPAGAQGGAGRAGTGRDSEPRARREPGDATRRRDGGEGRRDEDDTESTQRSLRSLFGREER